MTDRKQLLNGRTAVVTGGARGLGEAVARELAARGVRVALLGLEEDALARVAATLPTPSAHWHVDVTDDGAMARAAEEVRRTLGPVSVVVANAGVAEGGPFTESDPASWRRVIEVNLVGSAVTARVFLPQLLDTRGHYLQVASLASIGAAPMMSAYCASKAGVEALSHSLRAELAPRGVSVGIAYLNWIDTDMIRDADQYPVLRELRAHMPPPARRTCPAPHAARRLVAAIERRSPSVYVPGWLRGVQAVRAALPGVVSLATRKELTRSQFTATGLLGAGGRAAQKPARRP
ncbi:SDR family oxidoreductase [Streptomyces sp. A0958]|uniref:SDR family oxidoreductase n=1 Tax=Streptomyces sp. A0958 TaxID=2563101 RepID=UPI00109E8A79|nr:SDR family oxidoreductase [Streptomyces sp. A0958]THA63464.1 SDR family oxidoreductase [Streptomyces sp. A0958]